MLLTATATTFIMFDPMTVAYELSGIGPTWRHQARDVEDPAWNHGAGDLSTAMLESHVLGNQQQTTHQTTKVTKVTKQPTNQTDR